MKSRTGTGPKRARTRVPKDDGELSLARPEARVPFTFVRAGKVPASRRSR